MKSGNLSELKYDAAGLIPAVIQDFNTGAVLMVAWMNRESLEMTLQSGYTHFWSRSRQQFWKKGETSGHLQKVREIHAPTATETPCWSRSNRRDRPATPTATAASSTVCRTTARGVPRAPRILEAVYRVILDRVHRRPEGSYVASLLEGGTEKVIDKILEEAGEVAGAARDGDGEGLVHEVADLWFHTLVLLGSEQIPPARVFGELARRYGGKKPE